ncbi:Myrosinase 1 [Blattella germanica]|nr:Myrosinase 1 [Blattella germanica]
MERWKMDFYRFSVSWTRVLPAGDVTVINKAGIEYYKNLIKELLENGIEPVVKWWITFNEPVHICQGYADGNLFAPGFSFSGVGDYLVGHTVLKAHAKVYHLYDKEFRSLYKGKVGICLESKWFEPKSDISADLEASNVALQFLLGWFAHPIFSEKGDYPEVMKRKIAQNSQAEGRLRSRLPEFSAEWIQKIKGSADFFGLNHYSTLMVTMGRIGDQISREDDAGVLKSANPEWPCGKPKWLKVVPWGLRKLLNWIKTEYNNPPVFIAENGYGDSGEIQDTGRIHYYVNYIAEMLKAVNIGGCNVFAYTAWSLTDNYEWITGYTEKFGLYHINFNHPARPRIPKDSSSIIADIIRSKKLPIQYFDKEVLSYDN